MAPQPSVPPLPAHLDHPPTPNFARIIYDSMVRGNDNKAEKGFISVEDFIRTRDSGKLFHSLSPSQSRRMSCFCLLSRRVLGYCSSQITAQTHFLYPGSFCSCPRSSQGPIASSPSSPSRRCKLATQNISVCDALERSLLTTPQNSRDRTHLPYRRNQYPHYCLHRPHEPVAQRARRCRRRSRYHPTNPVPQQCWFSRTTRNTCGGSSKEGKEEACEEGKGSRCSETTAHCFLPVLDQCS
jgi:hypothetical protein